MVQTRRLEQSSTEERKIRANLKRMQGDGKYPTTRHAERILKGSSSSDTSDTEEFRPHSNLQSPSQPSQSFSGRVTRSLQSYPNINNDNERHMSDSDASMSSETQILNEAGPYHSTRQNEKFSGIPKKRQNPIRKTRLSLTSTKQASTSEESSISDESSSSEESNDALVQKEQRFKKLLKEKLSRTSRTNAQSRRKLSESDSSDSEIEKKPELIPTKRELPARTIRTPIKYRTPETPPPYRKDSSVQSSVSKDRKVTRSIENSSSVENRSSKGRRATRSTSVHKEINEKPHNDSQAKTTPSKSNSSLQNIQISLTRANCTPEFVRKKRSEETTETSASIESCSDLNQTNSQKETNGRTVECPDRLEELLQALEGSSDSEVETDCEKSMEEKKRREASLTKQLQNNQTSDNLQYVCHVCDQCFKTEESLRSHEELHSGKKNRKCKYCDKTFTRDNDYVNHLRKHNIDLKSLCVNSFKCDICKKLFAYRHVLRRHQLMHENRKDYKCKICNKKFIRSDYLKTHERLRHSKNPYFSCKICHKEFSYKHTKILHERMHTNEKPFKCRICNAAFSRKDYFKKHKTTHEIKRAKFICDDCDEVFVNKFTLQIHIQEHMKIKEIADREDSHVEVIQLFINDDWD